MISSCFAFLLFFGGFQIAGVTAAPRPLITVPPATPSISATEQPGSLSTIESTFDTPSFTTGETPRTASATSTEGQTTPPSSILTSSTAAVASVTPLITSTVTRRSTQQRTPTPRRSSETSPDASETSPFVSETSPSGPETSKLSSGTASLPPLTSAGASIETSPFSPEPSTSQATSQTSPDTSESSQLEATLLTSKGTPVFSPDPPLSSGTFSVSPPTSPIVSTTLDSIAIEPAIPSEIPGSTTEVDFSGAPSCPINQEFYPGGGFLPTQYICNQEQPVFPPGNRCICQRGFVWKDGRDCVDPKECPRYFCQDGRCVTCQGEECAQLRDTLYYKVDCLATCGRTAIVPLWWSCTTAGGQGGDEEPECKTCTFTYDGPPCKNASDCNVPPPCLADAPAYDDREACRERCPLKASCYICVNPIGQCQKAIDSQCLPSIALSIFDDEAGCDAACGKPSTPEKPDLPSSIKTKQTKGIQLSIDSTPESETSPATATPCPPNEEESRILSRTTEFSCKEPRPVGIALGDCRCKDGFARLNGDCVKISDCGGYKCVNQTCVPCTGRDRCDLGANRTFSMMADCASQCEGSSPPLSWVCSSGHCTPCTLDASFCASEDAPSLPYCSLPRCPIDIGSQSWDSCFHKGPCTGALGNLKDCPANERRQSPTVLLGDEAAEQSCIPGEQRAVEPGECYCADGFLRDAGTCVLPLDCRSYRCVNNRCEACHGAACGPKNGTFLRQADCSVSCGETALPKVSYYCNTEHCRACLTFRELEALGCSADGSTQSSPICRDVGPCPFGQKMFGVYAACTDQCPNKGTCYRCSEDEGFSCVKASGKGCQFNIIDLAPPFGDINECSSVCREFALTPQNALPIPVRESPRSPSPPPTRQSPRRVPEGSCPFDEIPRICGPPCQPTCESPEPECADQPCVEGCFCRRGFLRDLGVCVPMSECPEPIMYTCRRSRDNSRRCARCAVTRYPEGSQVFATIDQCKDSC